MYTINKADGERDLILEHGLSQLESDFVVIRDNKLDKELPLEQMEHLVVCAFMAAMHNRTKASREHHREIWRHPLEVMEDMIQRMKTCNT